MVLKSRSFLARAAGKAKAFLRDSQGGVAVTFGLAFPAVAFLSLVAVDYSRASSAKTQLQDTLDAAALIVARSTAVTPDAVDTVGDKAFMAQLNSGASGLKGFAPNESGRLTNVTFTPEGNKIVGSATGEIDPIVATVFLNGAMDVHASSEVVRTVNKLEIALVLDTTGSMQGTKIANLITAAKNFVTTMENAAAKSTETNPIKIAVVPFSQTVRVQDPLSMATYDTTNFTMTGLSTWLDGRNLAVAWDNDILSNTSSTDANRADRFRMLKQIGVPWGGCVEARVAPYDIRETAPGATLGTKFTPYFWPDEPDTHADYSNDYLADDPTSALGGSPTWSQRQKNRAKYNTTTFKSGTASPNTWIPNSAYGAGWAYGPNAACNMQKIMRLSTNFTQIKTHIEGLVASGETNIPIGLMWGWHALSPNAPFADGISYAAAASGNPKTQKIIVLMTDGDNTMNDTIGSNNSNNSYYHGYGYIWQNKLGTTSSTTSTRTTKMNERMVPPAASPNQEALCPNIKAQNIQIYTIGVGVSTSAKDLLTKCATAPDFYYDVDTSAGNLDATFSAIAGRIENLRIAK